MPQHIQSDLFRYLRELKDNNDRDWFEANKHRYVSYVKEPLLDFIVEFAPLLQSISTEYLAIPRMTGGSLFRIYRDTRFSKDKTPYKTHAAMQFRHSMGKDVHAPGFYVHLEPGNVFIACGIWRPETASLLKIRSAIADDPDLWTEILDEPAFKAGFSQTGESLARPPKGFDPKHPLIDELKRKDHIVYSELSEEHACRPDFPSIVADTYRPAARYMEYLTTTLGLPW